MLNNSWNYGEILNQNGEILIGRTSGSPVAGFLTSTAYTLSYTFGPGSINIEVNTGAPLFNPLPVGNGGTNQTILTSYGVLIGAGSNSVHVTAPGTNGQTLISSTTGDPKFSTLTSSSLTFTSGYNSLNIDVNFLNITLLNPLPVIYGGTGRTTLTLYGVLIGEGTNPVHVTAPGTNGQTLIASTTGDPAFVTITSSGGGLTFAFGVNSLNMDIAIAGFTFFNPWPAQYGGTSQTILTTYGVLLAGVDVTAAGTNGQLLIAATNADPAFASITSASNTISFSAGYNSLNMDVNFGGLSFLNPLQLANGGTEQTVLTLYGVLLGDGSNSVHVTASGTNGQLLLAGNAGDPAFASLTSTGNTIAFTSGYNSLNLDINVSGNTFFNPLQVNRGGMGKTILTTFGVILGEGSNGVHVTASGSSGQILIASSTGDPAFATLTSSGSTLTFSLGSNSLNVNVEVSISGFTFITPWPVNLGGIQRTILTRFGVLLGEGSGIVNVTAPGTKGQMLIASSTGDPAFAKITSTGGTLTFVFGYNSLNVDINVPRFTFLNPWPVQNGGTNRTILTTFGVLIGEGSGTVNVTAPGASGWALIGSSTGDPAFVTITSTGGTLSFVFGYNSLNVEVISVPPPVFFVSGGGTGQTTLTTFGVLIGEGSNPIHVTPPGTNGQVLIASSTGDPAFSTITSSGNTITFSLGSNELSINIETNLSNFTFLNPWPVSYGGTNRTILTRFGVLIGEGSNTVNATAAGTNGQVLISSTTGDPQFSRITSTGGSLTFVFGYNSLNLEVNLPSSTFFTPWPISYGGTNRTILTTYGVLLGEGSNAVNVTAPGTNGQTLIASSTGDPKFSTITSTNNTLSFKRGYNTLNLDLIVAPTPTFPIPIANGGTNRTLLTRFGVLIGEGSNTVNVTPPGTRGQVLIASSTGDPKFSTITSTGNTLSFKFGYNSLNIEVVNPNPFRTVALGGTNRTILTRFGVLIGEGSNKVNVTPAGTKGRVLIASSTGDPKFSTITSTGNTVTFKFGYNSLNMEVAIPNFTFVSPWMPYNGGTGQTILTTYGVLIGEGSNDVNVTAAGTNGQLLIASSTGDPSFSPVTSNRATLTFTVSYNSLNIDLNAPGFTLFKPWPIQNGGTNRTIFTRFGVLIGEGSLAINATAPGTNGQLLIASSTGDPRFFRLTSTGGTVTFQFGYNSLNIEIIDLEPFGTVPIGGTGRTVLTRFGVLIGEGSNNINVTPAGTNGQILLASSTGDPKFSRITSSGNTLTFVFGYNSLNIDVNARNFTFLKPWPVVLGGTGNTILSTYGVLIGEGSVGINASNAGTNGQVLIASSSGDPRFAKITSTGGTVTFQVGRSSLNIELVSFRGLQPISNGGTGRTLLTRFGVLVGEGSRIINATPAGTNGQVLIASSTGDPKFSRITSTGNSLTFTVGYNSLNIDLTLSPFTFLSPWPVQNGGTGITLVTTYGVLIGEGSNEVNVTAPGTNGQVLIASSTGDPKFVSLTSSSGTFAFTGGFNSLNADIGISGFTFLGIWPVQNGGTGRTILTAFGVLIGEGSNNVNVTGAGTNGQLLIASTTGDPKFSTITSTGNTITFQAGANSLNLDINGVGGFTFLRVWPVQNGGTGRTILTTYGVLIGEGSNAVNVTLAGTNGQLLIASTTGDPKFARLTSTGGTLTFQVGYNSLNMELTTPGFTFLKPWPVQNGGTGHTILTTFGVLVGEGSNDVNVTAAGTNGQVLVAAGGADPKFFRITSTGGTITFQVGINSLNMEKSNPNPFLSVANRGTGRTILTRFGVLIGEGSNNVNVTAAGTNGQALIASTTGDPKFSTMTSTGGTITFVFGANALNVDVNLSAVPISYPVSVANGGTGRTILTTFGVLVGEGSNTVQVTPAGTNGQLLIASTIGNPQFATVTSTGLTVAFTSGRNSLNMEIASANFTYLNPWPVNFGGTNRQTLTTNGVLIGEGSRSINVTAAGTNGQALIATTGADPQFRAITSTGSSLAFTSGAGSLNIDITQALDISFGGTNRTILTAHGVLIGENANAIDVTAAGTNGQLLIAATGSDPQFSLVTSNGNTVTFTIGTNSLNLEVNPASLIANTFLSINTVKGVTTSTLAASISTSFNYYLIDTTNGTVTLQFPASTNTGRSWLIKDDAGLSSLNPIQITTSGGTVLFDGQTSFNLTNPFGVIQVLYNGNSPAHYELF